MTDKTISFADAARARRQHYPAAGAGDADIVEAVHRIDVLTQLYLSTIRETVAAERAAADHQPGRGLRTFRPGAARPGRAQVGAAVAADNRP